MIVVNCSFSVKSEKREAFETQAEKLVQASKKDSGNLYYALFKNVQDKNGYLIVEHWQDNKALDKHSQTTHFTDFFKVIPSYLTNKYSITKLKNI